SAYYQGDSAIFAVEKEALVYIHNSANQGLDCLRPSMLISGLESVQRNQNRQNPDLRLFEFGKTYQRTGEKMEETLRLALLITGAHSAESWHPAAKAKVDFYTLKSCVQNLLTRLGISGYQESVVQDAQFQYALKLHRGAQELAVLGQVAPGILKKMDIKNPVFYADFNFENCIKATGSNNIRFAEISKYPSVRRDLALVLDSTVPFGDIRALANKTAKKMLREVNLFDVFEDAAKLGEGKKSYAVSFIFEDTEKTLQDKEIDAMLQQLQQAFEGKLGATIRK
ncbi:MAG: phenylalanine--tRNA ligase subunit beta, partial [Saprospiraceae bacterium]|nr:phenylalanine--tRNA ligase subunit beta [Saprospiraceae bacterium]